eukprot:CAMPEP_0194152826 /NCGR_PEP_ID=MMETSP0152-20130528/54142_1 /TAXON_ID=1049557 /ORGANISM="Thalassiothrix antarctica, Strain L6-D1" /LENGTH=568 /DNA_ID=CAMNT_0038857669 /DNA_START=68 /DNA_END=1774 /DNA_ORIENTATION=-
MPYRERIRVWSDDVVGELNALPYSVYFVYVVKIWFYLWLFEIKLRNKDVSWFAEDNLKRFILYNILGDVLGLNSTGGPLGMRFKWYCGTWYNLLVPGSITCPLLPSGIVSAKRHILQSVGYVVYLYFLVMALRAPLVTCDVVLPVILILAVLTPFDFVTFQASRGEHSGYMLVCCLFPWSKGMALAGMRLCQAALWFWAGVAKVGPWMKYVNGFMMPNSKIFVFLALLGVPVSNILFKDLSTGKQRDVNPSNFLTGLASFGCVMEIILGPLNLFFPKYGVPLAFMFHSYIISMMPFASVMEWNVFCLYLTLALFSSGYSEDGFTGYKVGTINFFGGGSMMHAITLSCFLFLVLFLIPLYGQIYPKKVPFLTAFRPYAGNWRFAWHIVSNKAKNKLRKLRCLEGVFASENSRFVWGAGNPHFCDQLEDYFTGMVMYFPHYRPLIPMIEKLEQRMGWKSPDEYTTLFHEPFLNSIMGWSLATGYYVNRQYFKAVASTCGFEENECFVAVFEPQGMLDHTSEWHLVDITKPDHKIYHGKCPYKDLEGIQPCDMSIKMFDDYSIARTKDKSQ